MLVAAFRGGYGAGSRASHHELHGLEEHRVRRGGASIHPADQVRSRDVEVVPQVGGAAEELGGAMERARIDVGSHGRSWSRFTAAASQRRSRRPVAETAIS